MILYNYRYRGPYEYDKFIYNVLQFSNETKLLEKRLFDGDYGILQTVLEQLDNTLENLSGEDSNLQRLLLISQQVEGE